MILKQLIIANTMIAFVACSGSSSNSEAPDLLSTSEPIITTDTPAQTDPKPSYTFDGDYEGDCAVKAFGISSSSCEIVVNIYHDTEAQTLGFVGQVDVNMSFISTSVPIYSAPLDIVEGDLIDSDGNVIGDMSEEGFFIEEKNGDWLRFKKESDGTTSFDGIYTDSTYGKVDITGSLDTVQK